MRLVSYVTPAFGHKQPRQSSFFVWQSATDCVIQNYISCAIVSYVTLAFRHTKLKKFPSLYDKVTLVVLYGTTYLGDCVLSNAIILTYETVRVFSLSVTKCHCLCHMKLHILWDCILRNAFVSTYETVNVFYLCMTKWYIACVIRNHTKYCFVFHNSIVQTNETKKSLFVTRHTKPIT